MPDIFNADGPGYSLIAIAPHLALDRDLPASWRSSTAIGGNPGASDAIAFTGTASADADANSLSAFLEHALGTSDSIPDAGILTLAAEPGGTVALTFKARLNADDVLLSIEACTVLPGFLPASATLISTTQTGATLSQTWRMTPPAGAAKFFTRLRATSR